MNQASSTNAIIDVLIVGAGPVGLWFANEMQQYGCNFRIIDKNETKSVHSKALGILPRTLEALDNRNLLEPFLGNGLTVHASAFRSADKQLAIVPYVGQNFDSPFPHPLLIPQVQTEYFLEDALCKASQNDSIVERNVMLLGYEENQDTNEVVARLARRTPEGEPWEEVVRARYIVGCDGVHSTVRKGVAGWLFEGHAYKSAWALADLTIRNEHVKDNEITLFLHHEGPVALFPYPSHDGKYRIVTTLGDFVYDDSAEVTHGVQDSRHQPAQVQFTELTLEKLRDIVARRVAPEKLVLTDPTWLSTFRINERIANGYRRGRAFIAGDAAHCHSPMGSQGMNMGLQDAHNLAWKLALVLKGKVKDVDLILDSYSAERRPVAAAVLKTTGQFTGGVSKRSGFADLVRTVIAPLALKFKSIQLLSANGVLGLGVNYTTSSPLNHPTPYILRQSRCRKSWLGFLRSFLFGAPRELIEPGTYLPDCVLKLPRYQAGCDTLMLHDVLRGNTTHTLILFSRDRGFTRSANPMVARVMEIAKRYKSTVRVVVLAYFGALNQRDLSAEECVADGTFAEAGTTLHERVGAPNGSQAVVVVRPDMYIVFSAVEEEIKSGELEKFLGGYLVEDAA